MQRASIVHIIPVMLIPGLFGSACTGDAHCCILQWKFDPHKDLIACYFKCIREVYYLHNEVVLLVSALKPGTVRFKGQSHLLLIISITWSML